MPVVHDQSSTRAVVARASQLQRVILPWMEVASCVLLGGALLWKGILPGWHFLNTDFPNYYLVARLLREGYLLDRIYDWVWLQRIKDHWGLNQPLVGFAGLTPFSALPIVPFTFVSALAAKRLWILTNVILLGASVELLARTTLLGRRRVWLLCLLAVFPLRTSFLLGQMHTLVLFLLVLAYYFRHNANLCGVCLSFAGLLKVYPLLFGLYFLYKKQWRPAFAMMVATLIFLGMWYLWIGSDAIHIYATQILPRSLQGEVLDPYSVHSASAAALFHRLLIREPALNPNPWLDSPALYSLLYPLWQLAVLVPLVLLLGKGREQLEWAAFVFALLLLSPVPASYHFVVMIFSVVLIVDCLVAQKSYRPAVVVIMLYCATSLIEAFPQGLLAFGRLWIELSLWGMILFCLWQGRTRPMTRITIRCCLPVLLVWTVSALGYHRHFQYQRQDAAARLPLAAPAAYLSTGVERTASGYVFTAMLADGYRVLDQSGRQVLPWRQMDQLAVASARNVPVSLIELADQNGSRILMKPSGAWIDHAESPAISPFATSVAFIREVKGRGTLWLGQLHEGKLHSEPMQIVDSAYDVRDVSFAPSGWIMFAAKMGGRSSIFSLVPGSQPKEFLSEDQDVDSPAVSPDGRLIAFRKLVFHRWQLGYIDLATDHEQMLTRGDCNAYSPGWENATTIDYATDCGRGLGLSALASVAVPSSQ